MSLPIRSLAVAAVAASAVAASVAGAAIPSSSEGRIDACRGPLGIVRVIDAEKGQACAKTEKPLSWSAEGGAPAAAAPRLAAVTQEVAPGSQQTVTVTCDAGEVVTGGGYTLLGNRTFQVLTSVPYVDGGEVANAWAVTVLSGNSSPQKVEVRALCVPVGPRG